MTRACILCLLLLAASSPAAAQESAEDPTLDAYLDASAAALVARARAARAATDEAILGYTAMVKQRTSAALRMPLKDRTVYRYEGASLVRWNRRGPVEVIYIAGREEHPGGVEVPDLPYGVGYGAVFEPGADRLYFGLIDADEEIWIRHPLGEDAESFYRYRTGDTLVVALQEGQRIEAVELEVLPRESSPTLVTGKLWVEPSSGHVVRAAYRLAREFDLERDWAIFEEDEEESEPPDLGRVPGMFLPITFRIDAVVIDYGLWELEHWLPRWMRVEGEVRAGVLRAPGVHEVSYELLDLATADDPGGAAIPADVDRLRAAQAASGGYVARERGRSGRDVIVLVPRNEAALLESPELPPAVWDDAPEFLDEETVDELVAAIDQLPEPPLSPAPWRIRLGLAGRDLVRYNRVESLSIGARWAGGTPLGELAAMGRFGLADREPNATLALRREGRSRTLEVRAYHELAAVDPAARSLGFGASVAALLLGRDDGEYYRATGGALTLEPPPSDRPWYRWTVYGERQRSVERETDVALPALFGDHAFRPVIAADRADQLGTALTLRPWSGSDPRGVQVGTELFGQAETGDFEFARASATLRAAVPLGERVRAAAELVGGTAWGDVPVQRLWYLGGAHNLRGFEGSSAVGRDMLRGRLELARTLTWGAVAAFGDAGWAGDFDALRSDDVLVSVGAGLSVLDGLVRIDLARGVRGEDLDWRVELYLDAIL